MFVYLFFFFFQAEDGIRDGTVTGVQTCALPISRSQPPRHQVATRLERVPAAADRLQHADVPVRLEAVHGLHAGSKAVLHPGHHAPTVLLARLEHPLHPGERERQRPLAQDVRTGREGGDHVDLVEVVRRADGDRCGTSVLEHFLDVVERLLDVESPREGLGLTQVRVADGADLHARQASQHREVGDLSDRARTDHRHADRVAHFGVPGLLSREPAQWYITPLRSDAVDTPLDRTPRASSVNRQRLAPISAPIVPFRPAVIEFSASCTKVPLMAGPLPCRMWAPSPIPRYVITARPCGRTYCRSTSPVTSLQVMRPRRIVAAADGSITTLLRRCSKRARAAALKSAL